jgi:RNA polymerase sigma-70 factor (ECF subfamily)
MDTDDGRFEALYRKYFPRVYRYFHHSCGVSDDEAQDLAQDTFKRIYENFNQYRGDAEWGFIQTTARRVLLNWLRAAKTAKRWAHMVALDDPELDIDVASPQARDYVEQQHSEARVKQLLKATMELPAAQRECLRLSVIGFKYSEIATLLKVTEDAVKSRVRDAKRQLRARLGGKA